MSKKLIKLEEIYLKEGDVIVMWTFRGIENSTIAVISGIYRDKEILRTKLESMAHGEFIIKNNLNHTYYSCYGRDYRGKKFKMKFAILQVIPMDAYVKYNGDQNGT
jgi:hypothetical protein